MTMIPSPGRIVHYQLSESDAATVNQRRADASAGNPPFDPIGNTARAGDVLPMLIVKAWGSGDNLTETTSVNGQVFLDGNDTLWVTSRCQGHGPSQWFKPPRV